MDATMTADMTAATDMRARLASPELRKLIERFVRRRAPAGEIDDVVQTVFCEALASTRDIADDEELRRWLVGIARHKVADLHRRGAREKPSELADLPEAPPPVEEQALADWAERQTADDPEAKRTLRWMAREGEGEKLATIAAEEKVSATAVRQRVSRLRRFMRERWMAELAAVAVLTGVVLVVVWFVLRGSEAPVAPIGPDVPSPSVGPAPPRVVPGPPPTGVAGNPLERAARLRAEALRACVAEQWSDCLDGLDAAQRLDPAGDEAAAVRDARARAAGALAAPSASAAASGSASAAPRSTASSSTRSAPPPMPTSTGLDPKQTTPQAPPTGKLPSDSGDFGNLPKTNESGSGTTKKMPTKPTSTDLGQDPKK